MKEKRIIFCGGGSGGHVMPALTIIEEIQKVHPEIEIEYIGREVGIEADLVSKKEIPYIGIKSGKLRRYFSWDNFLDIFKIAYAVIQSLFILIRRRNAVIFSFGGFVTVPVIIAGKILGMKMALHEQTSRAGLANKIASKLVNLIFISFKKSEPFFPSDKTLFTGYPIRKDLLNDSFESQSIKKLLGRELAPEDKLLFITGGGNGSKLINDLVLALKSELSRNFYIVHQVGHQFYDEFSKEEDEKYRVFSFIDHELVDLCKRADIIISRAGAGTVCELMALQKRSIYIPLKIAQKNEQYHNATEARELLDSIIIGEDVLNKKNLMEAIQNFKSIDKKISDKLTEVSASELIINKLLEQFSE